MSSEHPALKNFSSIEAGFKHVLGKALKWAAWGAVALGALAMAPAALTGVATTIAGWFGIEASAGTALLVAGLVKGATIGAVLGSISGLGGVFKAVEERKQDAMADYEQNMLVQERQALLSRGRGQSFANSEAAIGNVAYRAQGKNQGMSVG